MVTIDYINSILNLNTIKYKIIIVDNNSTIDHINTLAIFIESTSNENIILIKNNANIGYFKALNVGLKNILNTNFDFVIIGNNDLTFSTDFSESLTFQNFANDILVLAPNIICINGTKQNPHIINKFTHIQNIYRKIYFSNYYISIFCQITYNLFRHLFNRKRITDSSIEQRIFMGYGACYILTKNFFKYFNKLDDPIFLMGEEGVLTNQILSVNGSILYTPNIVVKHLDHTSIGKLSSKKLYNYSKDSYNVYRSQLTNIHHLYK